MRRNDWLLAGGIGLGVAVGCSQGTPVTVDVLGNFGSAGYFQGGEGGALPVGQGVDEPCGEDQPCRAGLACVDARCAPDGSLARGDACVIAPECSGEAQCVQGVCVAAGTAEPGEACRGDADCVDGLRCSVVGLALSCIEAGAVDVGDACDDSLDCNAGLVCAGETCIANRSSSVFPPVDFPAVDCVAPVESGVRALFEVPGADGAAQDDFFALPYPNDVRLGSGGHPDLSGFPTPGAEALGFDPLLPFVEAVEASARGWGANPVVIFRFSGEVDWESFKETTPFFWIDVTPGLSRAEGFGSNRGLQVSYHGARTNAVCGHWMAVRRYPSSPLRPGHTYAVWIERDDSVSLAADGSPIERSEHLEAMLASAAPSGEELERAWEAFQPLRDYLADDAMDPPDPDRILNATVLTVDDVRAPMAEVAAAIGSLDVPSVSELTKCGDGVQSPCPQAAGERDCSGSDDAPYEEYQALVTLPVFQEGSPPYLSAGGGISATKVRDEAVCLSLTVPKSTMPSSGWPLVVFAHATGESFRSHIQDGVAELLSSVDLGGGDSVAFAVLGIDQVAHGTRRGASTRAPSQIYFNLDNPDAARGNPIQGAADQLSLEKLAADFALETADDDEIRIDPGSVVFFGHGQGAAHGSLALPYASIYRAAVFSGLAASQRAVLLHEQQPVDFAASLPYVLGDPSGDLEEPSLTGGQDHPGLTLLTQWLDPSDPLHFASSIGRAPLDDGAPRHVLQVYGLDDTVSPASAMRTFAAAAGLDEAVPDSSVDGPDDLGLGSDPLPVPVQGNVTTDGEEVTLVIRQYGPNAGDDGHQVAFEVDGARHDIARFLAMAARGEVPAVGD